MTAARLRLVDEAKKVTAKKAAPASRTRTRPRARAGKRSSSVSDLMRSPAVCCHSGDTLHRAAQLMWEHDVGAIVVVDAENKPLSMVTDRDVCMGAYTQGVTLWQSPVESIEPRPIISCSIDADVADVRRLMERECVRRLAVVDAAGSVVGVVGLGDLVREAAGTTPKNRTRGLTPLQLAQTLNAVYEDVGVPPDRIGAH